MAALAAVVVIATSGCGGSPLGGALAPTTVTTPTGRTGLRQRAPGDDSDIDAPQSIEQAAVLGDATFVGAGDIANCDVPGAVETARLLDAIPGDVFTLGDHAYPNGTTDAFSRCYDPMWGRHRARTHPTPGNHDWGVENGGPYFTYFGANAGSRTGYYSFELGAWHILSLNSNVGAGPGSPQFEWVKADLAVHRTRCALAYWHYPRFSSGPNGSTPQMQQLWWLLETSGVDVVLSGHDHFYERFTPQDHEGVPTPNGMRLFVVGTGGTSLYGLQAIQPGSEVRGQAWGVLQLTLSPDRYSWAFVPVPGETFRDAGGDLCH